MYGTPAVVNCMYTYDEADMAVVGVFWFTFTAGGLDVGNCAARCERPQGKRSALTPRARFAQ